MGLGLIGKGFIDPMFLAKCGAQVIATDLKTAEQLAPTIKKLKKFKNITFSLGGHKMADFENVDFVLKNQGIPLDSAYIAHARERGIPVEMDESLFMKLAPAVTVIGVTGTRGKTTTTTLIYEILKASFGGRVHIAGNLPGKAALPILAEVKPGDLMVLELSSWQLQGFGDSKISPQISVFTNIQDDHLSYYKGDKEAYFADKANVYKYQKPEDLIICGAEVADKIGTTIGKKIVVSGKEVPKSWKLTIKGEHNLANVAYAIKVAETLKVPKSKIKKAVEGFKGIPGRLEFLKNYKGIKIYNDNNSTTPDATIAALRALGTAGKREIVLIIGGDDKKIDMSKLVAEIPVWCSKVVMFKERGTDLIRDQIFALQDKGVVVYEEEGIKACVKRAVSLAKRGETLLFSPAFSSFGKYFNNEYDRNDQFVAIVKKLR